ncbi:MAG: RNA methyltransferase [Proteobacteria bacterium]|jgi:tRNA (guanosine-2'-O-)-methyltransferase|nr:RNA methyltransferase [Pseudomonadota bacterium]
MSTRTRELKDAFRPRPMAERERELARNDARGVIEALGPRLSEERRHRIDAVVANRTSRLQVALEGVHDPHNAAAVVRTADAFGVQRVHIVEHGVRFRASRKVTQGTHKWVDISVWKTPEPFVAAMHDAGARVLVAAMDAAADIRELDAARPMALVFGNEADGISEELRELADGAFRIPMYGFVESLNVSVAAAIAISTLRARGGGDLPRAEADELRARFYLRAVRAGYEIACLEIGGRAPR